MLPTSRIYPDRQQNNFLVDASGARAGRLAYPKLPQKKSLIKFDFLGERGPGILPGPADTAEAKDCKMETDNQATDENEKWAPARLRISDIPTLKALDIIGAKLADSEGDYHRSAVLRRLLLSLQMAEALSALSDISCGMANKDHIDLLHEAFAESLIAKINATSKYKIDPLVKFLTKGGNTRERINIKCEIFTRWQRAMARVEGYAIEMVCDFSDGVKLSSYVIYCSDPEAAEFTSSIAVESMRVGVRKTMKSDFAKENKTQIQSEIVKS